MICSDTDILKRVKEKKFKTSPFEKRNVGPSSIDLILSNSFAIFKPGI